MNSIQREASTVSSRDLARASQHRAVVPLVGVRRSLTPVHSTAIPPRGLSGLLRRVAYGIPEYRARRWALLMLADRVDVIEHDRRAGIRLLLPVIALSFGALAVRNLLKSQRRPSTAPAFAVEGPSSSPPEGRRSQMGRSAGAQRRPNSGPGAKIARGSWQKGF